jgi:hypothetical protein
MQEAFMDGLTREVAGAMDRQARPACRLAAAVRAHVVYHGRHRREAFVTDTEIRALEPVAQARLIARRDEYEEIFEAPIREGVERGELLCAQPRVATYAILLQCTGVALWFDPRGKLSLDEVADVHVELVLGAVGASRELVAEAVAATR